MSSPEIHENKTQEPQPQRQEVHHHYHGRGLNFGSLALAIILIFLGVAYFAKSSGWVPFELAADLTRLWPIILMVIGLSFISARGVASTIIGIVLTLAVLALAGFMLFGAPILVMNDQADSIQKEIIIPRESAATTAGIAVEMGGGKLNISGSDDDVLINGTFKSGFLNLASRSSLEGTIQKIVLSQEGTFGSGRFGSNDMNFSISNRLPVRLDINSGASQMELSLATLLLEELNIDTGASKLELTLGNILPRSTINIDAGASSISIFLPKDTGVKVLLDAALSSKNLNDFNQINNNHFETANYATATKKIDIDLNLGVSNLNIEFR